MRKAYKKARWLKAFTRIEKRGGKVFLCYKTVKNVQEPPDEQHTLTYTFLLECLKRMGVDVSSW